MPIAKEGFIKVLSRLLHIRFGFCESSNTLEEEVLAEYGIVNEAALHTKYNDKDEFYWFLHPRQYRAYGLRPETIATSNAVLVPMSNGSTVQLPLLCGASLQSFDRGNFVKDILINLCSVKREPIEPLIDLTCDTYVDIPSISSEGHFSSVVAPFLSTCSTPITRTPANTPTLSSFSLPLVYPISSKCFSVMQCLSKLSNVLCCHKK